MQNDLPLFAAQERNNNILRFVQLLDQNGEWMSATAISMRLGLPLNESSRRTIRAWAEAAEDSVISGQKGYRHVKHCPPEEVHHFCSWMEHQAKRMAERAARTRRRAHQLVG